MLVQRRLHVPVPLVSPTPPPVRCAAMPEIASATTMGVGSVTEEKWVTPQVCRVGVETCEEDEGGSWDKLGHLFLSVPLVAQAKIVVEDNGGSEATQSDSWTMHVDDEKPVKLVHLFLPPGP